MNELQLDSVQQKMHQGAYESALDSLKEILSDDPNDALAHGFLALVLLSTGRRYAAEYEAGLALSLEPNYAFLHWIKAKIFFSITVKSL